MAEVGERKLSRASVEHLKNLQDFSNLSHWLAGFEIHDKPDIYARRASKFVLPQVLLTACVSNQSAYSAALLPHFAIMFPLGKIPAEMVWS
ncbi:hypothetical protein [Ciceribacter sp. RN22]|uniref:hypothetical protein n=1 Tax=Ciceribacter sp. RN22 TaxID=2954932 RepID=UPI0035B02209